MGNCGRETELALEERLIRRMHLLVDLTTAIIAQDPALTLDEAWQHVLALKRAVLAMFPDKEAVFDLIYIPRFSRLLAERFGAN
jgi:uncharacterized protein YigA (DUF484 family)